MIDSAEIFNASILIVDDLEANTSLLARMLASAGYKSVIATHDPYAVCELHRQHRYDLILLDLMMPGMDGFQVMEQLKKIEPDDYCPVLVITAQPQLKLRALTAGAKDFISKPFELAEVLARVSNMLEVRLLHKKLVNNNNLLEQLVRERTAGLQASEARLRTLIQTIPDLIWLKDEQGLYLTCNKMFERFFGAKEADIVGRSDNDFVESTLADSFREDDRKAIAAGKPSRSSGWITFADDGCRALLDTIKTPMFDDAGKLVGILGIARDITEHHNLEQQLWHANKMELFGTFAGGIAHDFNNILSVVMGYGAMAIETLGDESPGREYMTQVLIAADRALQLNKKLLLFGRKSVVDVKHFNVNELILSLEKMIIMIIRKSIRLNLDLAEMPFIVLADAGQIEQVLINLATNAKDAMPESGQLTIRTELVELNDEYSVSYGYEKPGRYVRIMISDTGSGMDAETRKRIFEPFYSTKGVGEGTGLGLAISYEIIKQHSGYITVKSESGEGSVFNILLPLCLETAAAGPVIMAVSPVKGGGETLLVADDEAALRELARMILESFGYTVITAEDGEDAIAKFMAARERISLVLLDLVMPKKTGKEVCKAVNEVSPRTKILFTSGYPLESMSADALTGPREFIQKPYQPSDLLRKVREMLDSDPGGVANR